MKQDLTREVKIQENGVTLAALLSCPPQAQGIVIFAHGSGSSRHSPRNQRVAQQLNQGRLATLLLDLLTVEEEQFDARNRRLRFDIGFLANRLVLASKWVAQDKATQALGIGYFGASTGAAAALVAAAMQAEQIQAVVSRGGRPDLAEGYLAHVKAPTLFLVGSEDQDVLALNKKAMQAMVQAPKKLELIKGASHLFEEPGTLDRVADLAELWFKEHLHAIVPVKQAKARESEHLP